MLSTRLALATFLAAACLAAGGAHAELYRCTKPDGGVFFTDNPGACGNARAHEPADVIQNVPTAPPPAARDDEPSAAIMHGQAERDRERYWRDRKQQKVQELARLEAQRQDLRRYAVWCNRGGDLYRKDSAGLKHKVSCKGVHAELRSLDERLASVRSYLDEGLEDECRRSGCLPGWIR